MKRPYIVCHMVASIDGRNGQTALFDGIEDMNRMPVKLSLECVDRIENGTLWIRYKTKWIEKL